MSPATDLFERAKVHLDRDEIEPAITNLQDYLNTDFWHPEAAMMLAYCYLKQGKPGIAAILNKQAVQTRPDFPEAWRNLGAAFKLAHKNTEAIHAWKKALAQEKIPAERARVLGSLGTGYVNEGDARKGIEYFDRGLALDPGSPELLYNRSLALLEIGNWTDGFAGYEKRFSSGAARGRRYGDLPAWDGSPGKRVIVWGDQGIGDEIMFASCLPDLNAISESVVLDCHPRLTKIFARSFPDIVIHGTRKVMSTIRWFDADKADAHVPISSLPMFFRKSDADFPGTPFLRASADRPAKTHTRPRIGISWRGGTHATRQDLRSIQLSEWAPILRALDADFFSLQYNDDAPREVCVFEEETGIRLRHFPTMVQHKDYDRTATFVSTLDLVITVPTAVYHLSNALGVPTWTLVPAKPPWPFGEKGLVWCSQTARFFRQGATESWAPAIGRVADELAQFYRADIGPAIGRTEAAD